MNLAANPRVVATTTQKIPGPFTTERGPNGFKGRTERVRSNAYRASPYGLATSVNNFIDVGASPRGQQSKVRGSVQTIITSQPNQNTPLFAQINSLQDGLPRQSFGGTPQQYIQQLQNVILAQQGLPTRAFGSRTAQPDMTSEVASDGGFSTYNGFAQPPLQLARKFDGTPGSTMEGWGLTQTPRPTGLQISMPTPNPGANGDGGDGFFANIRPATAQFGGQVDPFALSSMRQATENPIKDSIDQNTNQPMVMALMAMKSDTTNNLGAQVAFDETQEGQLMYEAVEDNGKILQAISKYEGTVDGNLLPHTTFNVVAANWFLAQEDKAPPLRGWKKNDILSMLFFHGAIRGDASARFGPGEPYGLARRIVNCNLGCGIESIFNEWGAVETGRRLYHIIKRVPHNQIRANPAERPGSFSLTGTKENVIVVKETKTKNPFQIVPWMGKDDVQRPTRKETQYINDDGIIENGIVFFVGIVFDVPFASPWKSHLDHSGTNCSVRAQLPMIAVKIVGQMLET